MLWAGLLGCLVAAVSGAEPATEPRYPWETPIQGMVTLGAYLPLDRDVHQYPFSGPGDQLELNPGVALTLGAGGQVQRWLRLEFETGAMANELHRIGNDRPDGYLANFPMLLNAIFLYDSPKTRWIPYVGVGAGGNFSLLSLESPTGLEGNFTDITYAGQALAGVRYKVTRKVSVGLGYRYFHTGSLRFEDEDTPASKMRFEEGGAHAFSLVIMIRR